MENYIDIQSYDLIQIISKIKIKVMNLILNKSATIKVEYFDDDNKLLNTYYFELVGHEYQMWRDDNYLIQYVCEKYNLILREPSVSL